MEHQTIDARGVLPSGQQLKLFQGEFRADVRRAHLSRIERAVMSGWWVRSGGAGGGLRRAGGGWWGLHLLVVGSESLVVCKGFVKGLEVCQGGCKPCALTLMNDSDDAYLRLATWAADDASLRKSNDP